MSNSYRIEFHPFTDPTDEQIEKGRGVLEKITVHFESTREFMIGHNIRHTNRMKRKPIKRNGVWVVRDLGQYRPVKAQVKTYIFEDGYTRSVVDFHVED